MDFCTEVPYGEELRPWSDDASDDSESETEGGSDYDRDEDSTDEDEAGDSQSDEDDDSLDSEVSGDDEEGEEPLGLAMKAGVMWPIGMTLRVRFLRSHPDARAKVRKYARWWTRYANVTFDFVSSGPSHIRIAFHPGGGHNSHVGTNNKKVRSDRHTMNLAINRNTSEYKIRRVVLREFGHALGCIHEHSSPAAVFFWNRKSVYAHYRKQGWDRATVDRNVLNVNHNVTQFSRFDPKSIMIYHITPDLTKNGFKVAWNSVLSQTDKSYIAMMYPPNNVKCNRCKESIDTSNDSDGHMCKSILPKILHSSAPVSWRISSDRAFSTG